MAVVAGGVSVGEVGMSLLLAVAGGIAIGFAGGWLTRKALGLLHDPGPETTVTLAVPFALYLLSDEVGASGVLAVLVAGLYLRATTSRELTSGGWLLGRSVWQYVDFAVSGVLFAFLGIELTSVLENATRLGNRQTLLLAGLVIAVLLVSRALVMFSASAVQGRRARLAGSVVPYGWRESAVASWAGMRGVVTVATALALPVTVAGGQAFPFREEVVLVALLVVIATLVVQGLTLAPLIRRLGVGTEEDGAAEMRDLGRRATQAGLERARGAEDVPHAVRAAVVAEYESRLRHAGEMEDLVGAKTRQKVRARLWGTSSLRHPKPSERWCSMPAGPVPRATPPQTTSSTTSRCAPGAPTRDRDREEAAAPAVIGRGREPISHGGSASSREPGLEVLAESVAEQSGHDEERSQAAPQPRARVGRPAQPAHHALAQHGYGQEDAARPRTYASAGRGGPARKAAR